MTEQTRSYGVFVPLLLVLITLTLWNGFQAMQSWKDRENLTRLRTIQAEVYGNAQNMRTKWNAILVETSRLAKAGNTNAELVVNTLNAQGIVADTAAKSTADK